MTAPRWRKVLRDVWLHKPRTALVVCAITIGIVGAGTVLNTWALVRRVTREGYLASNPASATLRTDAVDTGLLARVRAMPAVRDAQARRTVTGSARGQGGWATTMMFAYDDFTAVRIGQLSPDAGAWPPADGAFIVERSSVGFSGAAIGEPLTVAVGTAEPRELRVSGIARDVGLAPGWMEHIIYGFVTPATLAQLGAPSTLNELQIIVRDGALDREAVRRVAWDVKALLEADGHPVSDVDVPEPGQHVHAGQMNSLLYTQGAFGLLALVLSGFLVVNLIAAMLVGQVREIGIMKTLGAQPSQIAAMYLGIALVLGVVATAFATPLAAWAGWKYAGLKAELLNFDITGYTIPLGAIAVQIAVGALLPVVAAAFPVYRGCRVSVGEALRDVGLGEAAGRGGGERRRGGAAMFGRLAARGGLTRPLLLSLRNAFRKRGRMALTLVTLALGGAVYLGALNLRASVRGAVDLLYRPMRFDVLLRLTRPWPADSLEAILRAVPGVRAAEAWSAARATLPRDDGTLGNGFSITAAPVGSDLLVHTPLEGRWIQPGDSTALVVSRSLLGDEPSLRVGGDYALLVGGRPTRWTVVGVVDAGPTPSAFAPRAAIAGLVSGGLVDRAAIATAVSGPASQVDVISRLRGELERQGYVVQSTQLLAEGRRVMEDHLLMVVDFLGVMAWLMIAVGGLGLASTMSLAVLERTREIGVLRAIGARHRSILAIIQVEGLVIAVLSWIIAIPVSVPMGLILGEAFGRVMVPVPPSYLPNAPAVLVWLGLVVVVSVAACAWPAWRAMRVPTAAALAYE